MFCPKCGTQNPETGRFCRACGTDLSTVLDALAVKSDAMPGFGMIQPLQPMRMRDRKGKSISWESAIVKLFTGLAFIIISLILSFSPMGRGWWFWLLIPAFSIVGGAVAQIVQLRKTGAGITLDSKLEMSETINSAFQAADLEHIEQLLTTGRKIEAIKVYREISGVGLKKAKTAVERIENGRANRMTPIQPENPNFSQKKTIYDTGNFSVAPSVTEGTTRHLEMDDDGETMTLPKQ